MNNASAPTLSRLAGGLALALLVPAPLLSAAQPQFWKLEGARDFLDGESEGLSVDSEGRLRLAPASRPLHDPEAPHVWCLAADGKDALYAGTGNDGKVFRIEDGKASLLYDSSELEVHALAVGPDHRLYAGTSPDGKVYAIDDKGKAETFYDPPEKYIWALAFDAAGTLFVATGAEGRIHKVDRKGTGLVVLTSPETHVLSLAVDDGNVYAGSAPNGILYRLDPSLRVFVLHDSHFREAKALDLGPDGSLYVAAVDGKEREETRPPAAVPVPVPPGTGEVTVTESFSLVPQLPIGSPVGPAVEVPRPGLPGTAKGAVLRILPSGEVETLWTSTEDTPHALVHSPDGVVVGTGNKGKLFRVRDDRTWTMVAAFPMEQVTALARRSGGSLILAASNPGKVYALEAASGERGTFTSKVKDTETVSTWGRLRWDVTLPAGTGIELVTRSGNTAAPDSTWSAWSAAYSRSEGDPVTSERARFVQVRAILTGKSGASPVLDGVSLAYLQRNLRPQVQSITVHPAGEVFQKPISVSGDIDVLGLEGPPPDRPSSARMSLPIAALFARKLYQKGIQTFTWKADDPNGDTLNYDVRYRAVGDTRLRLLRKGLTEAVLAWDTSTVPNGRYLIQVTASDAPSNPDELALSGDKESVPFEVDNTPPSVTAALEQRSPIRVRVVARDDASLIRRAEYSRDGGRWEEVYPIDGINDAREETYELRLAPLPDPGPHLVVVRVTDQLGNVATARVETP